MPLTVKADVRINMTRCWVSHFHSRKGQQRGERQEPEVTTMERYRPRLKLYDNSETPIKN